MTWSIIARDPASRRVGIAVATRFFAVGAMVPHVRAGAGAIATQAFVNPLYGPQGLALLQAGGAADDVVRLLTIADEGRDHRQVHAMDNQGRFAAFTGSACVDWCGHRIHDGFSVAGNMLAGPQVLDATAESYQQSMHVPFARRLITAMMAGEAAGGDSRGKQSAALRIHDEQDYALLDLRVDDHPDPLAEIARLEAVARERWVHFRRAMPSKQSPAGLTDRSKLEELIARSIAEGYE